MIISLGVLAEEGVYSAMDRFTRGSSCSHLAHGRRRLEPIELSHEVICVHDLALEAKIVG